jgi:hypothetical protein
MLELKYKYNLYIIIIYIYRDNDPNPIQSGRPECPSLLPRSLSLPIALSMSFLPSTGDVTAG